MTYADEQLSFSPAASSRRRRYTADLDAFITDYERVQAIGKRDARELKSLRGDFQKLQREAVRLRAEVKSSKLEIARLKATLLALRDSRSMRAGKAVMLPVRGLRKTVREVRRIQAGSSLHSRAIESGRTSSDSDGQEVLPAATAGPPAVLSVQQQRHQQRAVHDENLARVEEEATAKSVMRAVSHSYFVLGNIREPADLIRRHSGLLEELAPREKRTVQSILGLDRLLDRLPLLSPQQPNPGYQVERGRVMYCAHSTGHFNSNGYSTRTAELAQGLVSGGLEILVAARPGYPWDVATDKPAPGTSRFTQTIHGVEHVFSPGPSWTQQSLDDYWYEATDIYVQEAQRSRVEAIHSASNHVTALPALAAARRLGIPFSYEVRGFWEITEASAKISWEESERYQLAEQLETYVASNADVVFAITEQVRDELVRRGVEPQRIRILPNGVDTDRFSPMPASNRLRNKLSLDHHLPVIGYAGSLVHYEGISDLLKALALLKAEGTAFQGVIVGDGPELADLRTQAAALGLNGQVHFTGRVDAKEVPEYVSLFDVMPCPRIRLRVTELVSPLKPLEAMAAGKAMVLTDLAPLRTLAGEGQERALLAEPSAPESLAKAIGALLDDPDLRRDMGQRARRWTVGKRQWRSLGQEAGRELATTITGRNSTAPNGRSLQQITIGIIADTFTTEGLRPDTNLCEVLPETWREQLKATPLDVLFVESAWEGLGGTWRQRVGYYDEERFSALRELIQFCNEKSIPTIFWNKEDPIHLNRFRPTAELFDHVFTTDADCIRKYAESRGDRTQTIASLPFYAQPALHNPLPVEPPYSHTVAYAGSYYGDRYPQRSAELTTLLEAAQLQGLTIYDRQHLNSDSPYQFPEHLRHFVRGGLPYMEMVKAYKAHPVHINVNSVDGSPTMFSRRVVELAASGTAVLSGKGRGVQQVLAGLIQTVATREEADELLTRWMDDEEARLEDVWLAFRLIHRGHTAAHRLAYALRCAGLVIRAPQAPSYAVRLGKITVDALRVLEAQTVRPSAVLGAGFPSEYTTSLTCLEEAQATPRALSELGIEWVGDMPEIHAGRTVFEDLLSAVTFGNWSEIGATSHDLTTAGEGLAVLGAAPSGSPRLISTQESPSTQSQLLFRRPNPATPTYVSQGKETVRRTQRILVAGHDLKFAGALMDAMKAEGHTVTVDQWQGHNQHDEEQSKSLLASADVVFCEWTLGNAAWYSKNLLPNQRLVTRFHSQELFTPYLKDLTLSRVDDIIFVGKHIADLAIRDHGIPAGKVTIVPNPVNISRLAESKSDTARFHLGMVGIVPAQKHLDRALDLLQILRSTDSRYRLHVKGKRPEDFSWMANRPEEMAYYQEQYLRIDSDPVLKGAVQFDGHGDDMAEWYRNVGVVLSMSDFESFHLTLADGAASGAVPVSLPWPGADQIYPTNWIHPTIEDMATFVREATSSDKEWRRSGEAAQAYVASKFSEDLVLPRLLGAIVG